MSYPNGTASIDFELSNINSSDFSPEIVTAAIIDNITPLNNAGFKNSLGYQISLTQNFVNEEYLGRATIPVSQGYISNLSGINAEMSQSVIAGIEYVGQPLNTEFCKLQYNKGLIVGSGNRNTKVTVNQISMMDDSSIFCSGILTITADTGPVEGANIDLIGYDIGIKPTHDINLIPNEDLCITNSISGINNSDFSTENSIKTEIPMQMYANNPFIRIAKPDSGSGKNTITFDPTKIEFNSDVSTSIESSHDLVMSAGTSKHIKLLDLPTSDPSITGALWNDSGTLKISA